MQQMCKSRENSYFLLLFRNLQKVVYNFRKLYNLAILLWVSGTSDTFLCIYICSTLIQIMLHFMFGCSLGKLIWPDETFPNYWLPVYSLRVCSSFACVVKLGFSECIERLFWFIILTSCRILSTPTTSTTIFILIIPKSVPQRWTCCDAPDPYFQLPISTWLPHSVSWSTV